MTMTNLAELLSESQSEFLIYDLGRRVQAIDADTFQAISAQQRPYPYPLQDHAWFAVVFWSAQTTQPELESPEPFLWFLKMPLDERGLLSGAAQQEFMAQVIALLGQRITGALNEAQEQQLQQSAYLFTPSEAKRAAIHAQLTARWHKPASSYYPAAQKEIQEPSASGWQLLGIQGIHDLAVRLANDQASCAAIAEHFSAYPDALQNALAEALEHTTLPPTLAASLRSQIPTTASPLRLNLLRALAGTAATEASQNKLAQILASASMDELVIIAARLWPALQGELMQSYLLRVAELQHPALFAGIVRDLLRVPDTRIFALGLLQRNDLPVALYQAWQQFIGQKK